MDGMPSHVTFIIINDRALQCSIIKPDTIFKDSVQDTLARFPLCVHTLHFVKTITMMQVDGCPRDLDAQLETYGMIVAVASITIITAGGFLAVTYLKNSSPTGALDYLLALKPETGSYGGYVFHRASYPDPGASQTL
ncbi:predicted protein [Uncinocarpus reesii 1704]|uniref:Uncharacterized protein n=1 Tax=Uncinocarpus reesii (strain UAMH 1704) TaxID=336963 RepID=C4JRB8_UNCRE|nr:uncharacterized protein UREG_05007 [Uncinocarpus reesii 1704]EEP80165.1 predicted protein [Uncinocarpus reesii 1704]